MYILSHYRPSVKDFVYIGLRSVDPYEKLIINDYNIHYYGMKVKIKFINIIYNRITYILIMEINLTTYV